LRGNIPSFIFISDGKLHDVNILDQLEMFIFQFISFAFASQPAAIFLARSSEMTGTLSSAKATGLKPMSAVAIAGSVHLKR
jgi:hypothetical protein